VIGGSIDEHGCTRLPLTIGKGGGETRLLR